MTAREAEQQLVAAIADNSVDILRYFARRVGADEASDLVAETMMAAWRRAASLPPEHEQARMWLFGIARNVLANAQRSERRRLRLANRLRLLVTGGDGPAPDQGVEVRDAIERLPADQADVVRLVHWDGFSLAEVAQMLDEPPTTTRSRYARAKESLRRALETQSAASDHA